MNRTLLITILFLFHFTRIFSQTGWHTLPNIGLIDGGRYDDIWFFNADTGLTVTGEGHIYKTYDGGNHWYPKLTLSTETYFRSLEFLDDNKTGIAGALTGRVYRTTDAGENWVEITASIPDTSGLVAICGLAHNNNTFYGVGYWSAHTARIYKSSDAGQTWNTIYVDTSLATCLVDVTFLSARKGFATGCRYYNHYQLMESVVLKTEDSGKTWIKVFSDNTIGGRIWKIQFVSRDIAYASIEPEISPDTVAIIKSTDGGNSWQILPVGRMGTTQFGTQGIGFINPTKGWVGGYYQGMFETDNGGLSWHYTDTGNLCNRYFKVNDNLMYLSGFRVFKYTQHPEAIPNIQPYSYIPKNKLYPITPNPSSGEIKISLDIGIETNTRLEVIDITGKKVFPIISERLKAGQYTYQWDGRGMPDGTYLVWLGTDEAPYGQKFVLKKH